MKGIVRYGEKQKERFLSRDEFQRLAAALDQFEREDSESLYAITAIRLLIQPGARLSEILTLQWENVQFDRRRLRLIDSKTGPKNIELTQAAIDLLENLPRIEGNPYVIVGRRHARHLVDLQRPWQRVRSAAGLSDVRIHDLRHSFASLAIRNGVSINVIGKLLGHRSSETTRDMPILKTATSPRRTKRSVGFSRQPWPRKRRTIQPNGNDPAPMAARGPVVDVGFSRRQDLRSALVERKSALVSISN
ncbi:site-specific integrase [Bosea sp. F3-2]|uniref:site-specific integrase n=1 Tax=Bosea sp. F3-2 TaxID=2599640 RepID=UPI00165501B5|nr:site-specific integrase [Bosea sp. F3-2]